MKQFKKSKHFYNNKFFKGAHDNFFLVFGIFNINLSLVTALRLSIEDNLGLRVTKIDVNLKVTYVYIEIDFKYYSENKEDLIDYFSKEDFKFFLISIYYNGNNMSPIFFEDTFLQNLLWFDESPAEILYFNYVNILNNQIEKKKIVFFFYNFIILNKTMLYYNGYNTPISI